MMHFLHVLETVLAVTGLLVIPVVFLMIAIGIFGLYRDTMRAREHQRSIGPRWREYPPSKIREEKNNNWKKDGF